MRKRTELFFCVMAIALAVSAQDDANATGAVDTVKAVNGAITVSTASAINTVDTSENKDTVSIHSDNGDSIRTSTAASPTINTDGKSAAASIPPIGADSSAAINKPNIRPDTAEPRLSGTYIGLGIGLAIGDVPIFHMWQSSFPDSLRRFGLSPDFGRPVIIDPDIPGDTALLRYRITETPDEFNFALPITLSLHNINEKRIFSFAVSFFQNSKQYQSTITAGPDTSSRRVEMVETLRFYSLSIEAGGQWAIPPQFFSISGAQQTLLLLALGASPVNTFTRDAEISARARGTDERINAVTDSARKTMSTLTGNGLSLSWRAGINTVRRYQSSGRGLELGVFYSGAYSAYFYSDGVRLTEEHIKARGGGINNSGGDGNEDSGKKPLSFLSHRAEFRVSLLIPAKRKTREEQ